MEAYRRLEAEWAEFNGLDPAGMVACSSGTAALHLALEAASLPPGSEVLCADFNMVAVPRAIALAGLTPTFVDCRADLLMDLNLLEPPDGYSLIGERSKIEAVVLTHVYGRRCGNWKAVDRSVKWGASAEGGPLQIEDLAEAHGVRPYPETDAACWSFFANKIVAGQEGGAVWFRDLARAALARELRCLGFTAAHDYRHVPRGHNYRMSNLHAGFILAGLPENPNGLPVFWANAEARRWIEAWYCAACPPDWRMPARDAVWVYDVRVPGLTRERLLGAVRALKMAGVEARPGFLPMSRQEEFRLCRRHAAADRDGSWSSRTGYGPQRSEADRAADEVLYLPVRPGETTEADCRRAFRVLRDALAGTVPPAP